MCWRGIETARFTVSECRPRRAGSDPHLYRPSIFDRRLADRQSSPPAHDPRQHRLVPGATARAPSTSLQTVASVASEARGASPRIFTALLPCRHRRQHGRGLSRAARVRAMTAFRQSEEHRSAGESSWHGSRAVFHEPFGLRPLGRERRRRGWPCVIGGVAPYRSQKGRPRPRAAPSG